jgi:2-iminobutanoate/2-iminopropanoate deaminase
MLRSTQHFDWEVFRVIRNPVTAPGAPAIGPYSHGVQSGGFLFLSGQTPIDGATGQLVDGGLEAQVRQCFRNLEAVLVAADLTFDNVVKCNVFLVDMDDFGVMNRVYAEQFRQPHPARTTIGVAALPMKARVEIEMIASTGYSKENP